MLGAVSLGYFALARATKGFALWTPTTFEKVDETFAWLRSTYNITAIS